MSGDESRPGPRKPKAIRRAQLPAGALKDLKDALYALYTGAGQPTLDEITAEVQRRADELDLPGVPKRDTINRILGDNRAHGEQDVITVAVVLAHLAGRDVAVIARQVRELWQRAQTVTPAPRLGRPIGEYTPFALEVRRAIEVADFRGELPMLPPYVPRAHDARLREVIDVVVGGASRMAMLVGGSSTGKTRACWEAVHALPARWWLWHPIDPGRPQAAARALAEVGPYTVLWLNEAQHYLLTADPALGEQIAAGLRTLLTDPARQPVLVLGTMWPQYWATLTAPSTPGEADPYAQAREVLTGTDIAVPEAFTAADLAVLADRAASDPRLREAAVRAHAGRVTQHLAGVPELLQRYRHAPTLARAVIDAAIDARRLGHPPGLSHAFLEDAAPGYVTDHDWNQAGEDWLEQALAYTAAPCHGTPGPVTRIRPRPGEHADSGPPSYWLADYLEQAGSTERAGLFPPDSFWNAIATTVTDPDTLRRIGEQAEHRGRYHRAVQLYRQAADRGDADARRALVRLQEQAGASAAEVLDRLARRDTSVGGLEYEASAVEMALDRQDDDRIRLGTSALHALAKQQEQAGDAAGAEVSYRQAADRGDTGALCALARLREQAGDAEGAKAWAVLAAGHGDTSALDDLARRREAAGDGVEAEALAVLAADYGNTETLWFLAWLRDQAGDAEAAEALAVQVADRSGNAGVLSALAAMRELAGDTDGAEALHRQGADRGRTGSMRELARLRHRAGYTDDVDALYRKAIDRGDSNALLELAELRQAVGDSVGAGRLVRFGLTEDGEVATMLNFASYGGLVGG
jgi:tetratricopeptide (TPR) repeat protein